MNSSISLPDIETLNGTWESPAPEPMPREGRSDGAASQRFVTRAFDFHDQNWRVRYTGYADPDRRLRVFDGVNEGTFELKGPWDPVPDARAAVFHFSRRLLTVHTAWLAKQLSEIKAGNGTWAPGIQQDVSVTGALFVPSLANSSAEYDLVAFEPGPKGALDLYLGDRSHEMNTPELRPKKRIAFLVQLTSQRGLQVIATGAQADGRQPAIYSIP
jgi:hypothetical protein